METYFITIPDIYSSQNNNLYNRRRALDVMADAFGVDVEFLEKCAKRRSTLKVTAEQLGEYIAERNIQKIPSAVAEPVVEVTPAPAASAVTAEKLRTPVPIEEVQMLYKALLPFSNAMKGHYSNQPDSFNIFFGANPSDIRTHLPLRVFREAAAAIRKVS